MSIEQTTEENKSIEQTLSPEQFFKIRERIQVELMKRYIRDRHIEGSENDGATVWIEQYSKVFSDIIVAHSEFVLAYTERPEDILSQIEQLLYSSEEPRKAA